VSDPLQKLREYQDGKCAVCEERKELLVDHDHDTGWVRGLLCNRCNTTEGQKDWPWLRAYRENPPAKRIGLKVRYSAHQAQGLREHFQRKREDPATPKTLIKRTAARETLRCEGGACEVWGCRSIAYRLGLCTSHYEDAWRHPQHPAASVVMCVQKASGVVRSDAAA
jgi:hypothetical protein